MRATHYHAPVRNKPGFRSTFWTTIYISGGQGERGERNEIAARPRRRIAIRSSPALVRVPDMPSRPPEWPSKPGGASPEASENLKRGIRYTIMRLNQRDAAGMVQYYWSAIVGTDPSIAFAARLRQEGFGRFEEAIDEFRVRFDNRWLRQRP